MVFELRNGNRKSILTLQSYDEHNGGIVINMTLLRNMELKENIICLCNICKYKASLVTNISYLAHLL